MSTKQNHLSHAGLEDEILLAFRHAYKAKRFDAANHLLCALETLQDEPRRGTALRDAYMMLGADRQMPSKQ